MEDGRPILTTVDNPIIFNETIHTGKSSISWAGLMMNHKFLNLESLKYEKGNISDNS